MATAEAKEAPAAAVPLNMFRAPLFDVDTFQATAEAYAGLSKEIAALQESADEMKATLGNMARGAEVRAIEVTGVLTVANNQGKKTTSFDREKVVEILGQKIDAKVVRAALAEATTEGRGKPYTTITLYKEKEKGGGQ